MRKSRKGKPCLPLAVFGLVMGLSLSTAAQTENPEPQTSAEQKGAEHQGPPQGGQQPSTNAPKQGEAKPGEPEKKPQDQQGNSGTTKDRMFGVMPNFLTLENSSLVPPLTAGQKFKGVARSTFDPFQFFYYGLLAGISQAQNSLEGYDQGAQGYGKRYGAICADTTIENFMTGAILPSLLRQDPRYFQMGKGGFGHRAWYAATRVFVIRGDSGQEQFNASEVVGSALGAGISTYSYHPREDRKLTNLASTWGAQLGSDVFGFMMKEFWPDIRRHLSRKRGTPAAGDQK